MNPYPEADGWYWYDESDDIHGPYEHRDAAQIDLSRHSHYVETGEVLD